MRFNQAKSDQVEKRDATKNEHETRSSHQANGINQIEIPCVLVFMRTNGRKAEIAVGKIDERRMMGKISPSSDFDAEKRCHRRSKKRSMLP